MSKPNTFYQNDCVKQPLRFCNHMCDMGPFEDNYGLTVKPVVKFLNLKTCCATLWKQSYNRFTLNSFSSVVNNEGQLTHIYMLHIIHIVAIILLSYHFRWYVGTIQWNGTKLYCICWLSIVIYILVAREQFPWKPFPKGRAMFHDNWGAHKRISWCCKFADALPVVKNLQ